MTFFWADLVTTNLRHFFRQSISSKSIFGPNFDATTLLSKPCDFQQLNHSTFVVDSCCLDCRPSPDNIIQHTFYCQLPLLLQYIHLHCKMFEDIFNHINSLFDALVSWEDTEHDKEKTTNFYLLTFLGIIAVMGIILAEEEEHDNNSNLECSIREDTESWMQE